VTAVTDPDLTARVLASFAGTPSPRLREITTALVRHLHAFVSEVRPTEDEWARAVDFLTRTGQTCDDRRQEMILLSDVLGVSMLVIGLNHPASETATASTVFGPFFVDGSPEFPDGADLSAGAPGDPCLVTGRVRSTTGDPLPGARIEVWQADESGRYDVQYPDLDAPRARGHLFAGPDGHYRFWSVRPVAYPIPDDGPVGDLLHATARPIMRPAHIHFMVTAPHHRTLTTHVFAAGDPHLGADAVFGERPSLITPFHHHPPGTAPDGRVLDQDYYTATFDLLLDPAPPQVV
jgi:hydroxyquinol 1,2-dioxygenase